MGPPVRSAPPPPPPEEQGASPYEQLLAAAKTDNEELFLSALNKVDNVNHVDGLGNTALHYAIMKASTGVLELLLDHEKCDVDLKNRLQGETPLHIAVRNKWEDQPGLRLYLVVSLLEAGASTTTKNRHGERPIDLLPPSPSPESDDGKVRQAIRTAEAEALIADRGDVVDDDDDIIDSDDVASDPE
ncbi:hypothetical protein M231_00851 [Tremella mesenterica]|uniref:Uncharacterized protein n=1 Tax=Tremella mesenterica TaxID=5217 RepID=A0A4Q1BV12_TREME|nr:hypothetical protein M231_00851 [Tremella mesenterica]